MFTNRATFPTPFGDSIFRCTAKDRGERRASSSQAPHPSFCLSGQKLSRSAAPPLPTKPTSLGFGGAPVGGPLDPRGNVLDEGRRARVLRVSPKGTSFGRAGCNLRDLGPRVACFALLPRTRLYCTMCGESVGTERITSLICGRKLGGSMSVPVILGTAARRGKGISGAPKPT